MNKMRAGLVSGIAIAILGIIVLTVEYFMIKNSGNFHPKLLALSMMFIVVGLVMLIFPGPNMSFEEMRALRGQTTGRGGPLWKNAPTGHKVMWIVAAVIGGGLAIYVSIDLEHGGPVNEFVHSLMS